MAENDSKRKDGDTDKPKEDVVLIAQVRAHLLDGESLDLLPFRDEEDVRSSVNEFIEEWARTGFLLQDRLIFPWLRVKQIEVLSVDEMTAEQARPYDDTWQRDSEAHKAFWKTRKPRGNKKDENEKGKGGK